MQQFLIITIIIDNHT